jgi:hypothetical protein
MNDPNTFDKQIRRYVYDHFIKVGQAPTLVETAAALTSSLLEVEAAHRRLAEGRALVLQAATAEVLMAPPFSAIPTPFKVEVGDRSWWGNCIWDALGIPAMLKEDVRISTSCGDCNEAMVLTIKDEALLETSGLIHFALPAKQWWSNIVFT